MSMSRQFWDKPGQIVLLGAIWWLTGCQVAEPDFDPRDPEAPANPFTVAQTTQFQAVQGGPELTPEMLRPSTEPYRIGVGDVLELEISEVGGTRATTFVMPDGKLYFNLAGGVDADGLTIDELSERLTEALRHDYADPRVNVTLKEVQSRRVWVLGRVNTPGLYPLSQPTTLLEAISLAGGLFTSRFSGSTEELADLGHSVVLRQGRVLPVDFEALMREGDMSQNIYLEPDDYIYLPSSLSQNIYVLGYVQQARAIGFKDRLTLVAALAEAKGPRRGARMDQVVIIRGSLHEPQVAVVDAAAILRGQATDIELRPFDIVWVPRHPWDRFDKYFWGIWETAARTVAVNEGSLLVEGAEADTSVTIPASSQ